jgi:RNA polymerase sigma-70 factor (ECF subfamily)
MDNLELRAELERHHHQSYGWALSCCTHDPDEAKEVLQTVFLKILEGKARYGGQAAFQTWLFQVIRKTAAELRRRHWLRRLGLIRYREHADKLLPPEPFSQRLDEDDAQAAFKQALASLPKRQREVLQLVFYHDLSLSQVAVVMSVSLGAARTHYERGKKQLRQKLKSVLYDQSRPESRRHPATLPCAEA